MALIKCSECGRTVSDKAKACVGCGAPLGPTNGGVALQPQRPNGPPPTRQQLTWRAAASLLALAIGILWSGALGHPSGNHRLAVTLAAVLVVVGLCGAIVTAVQYLILRK